MKKLGFIISILICSVFFVSGQNEGNIWYFGENAGLDFNSGSPVTLTNGQLNTLEGWHNLNIIFEGIQGLPTIDIDLLINEE